MKYTIAVCTVKNSWWWTEELSETCRILFQNKFEKLVHLVGFIIRICHDARSRDCNKIITRTNFIKSALVLNFCIFNGFWMLFVCIVVTDEDLSLTQNEICSSIFCLMCTSGLRITTWLDETCSYILWYLCGTAACFNDVGHCFVDTTIIVEAPIFLVLRSHKLTANNSPVFQANYLSTGFLHVVHCTTREYKHVQNLYLCFEK
jgi:hypothetical protein